jgi:glycosyltransferase involved in cell wall biosynthesis
MRIVHISTADGGGGGERGAYRLHCGLRHLNQDSSMLVASRRTDDRHVTGIVRSRRVTDRLRRFALRHILHRSAARYAFSRPRDARYFVDDRSELGADLMRQLPPCDIFNLHAIYGFVDFRSFFRAVPRRTPLVWTLRDPIPFTGGCHYYGPCRRFNDRCGACPELGSRKESDLSRDIWRRKKTAYSRIPEGRFHLVTPSRWLAGEARQSTLLGSFPVSVIPNGLDTEVFSPRDRTMARAALDIPRDAKVVLFVAASIRDPRKGFTLLAEALAPLPSNAGIHLVSVGRDGFSPNIRLPTLSLGYLENDRILSLAYSAADVLVTPSLDDNLPHTAMESLSCGTPVVGFEVGGVPDMVRNGVTGFVVPKGDTEALRQAILRVLDNPTLRGELAANCRRIALEEYGLMTLARRYLDLYTSMTKGLLRPN